MLQQPNQPERVLERKQFEKGWICFEQDGRGESRQQRKHWREEKQNPRHKVTNGYYSSIHQYNLWRHEEDKKEGIYCGVYGFDIWWREFGTGAHPTSA